MNGLSTLFGIKACGIIFGQDDPELKVWPSPMGVQRVIAEFNKLPEEQQTRKNINQYNFLKTNGL